MKLSNYLALVIVITLLGLGIPNSMQAQPQHGPLIYVKPGQSIEEMVNQAPKGTIIYLGKGTWKESVTITKTVALVGTGKENTEIKAVNEESSVFTVKGKAEVHFQKLTLRGGLEGIVAADSARVSVKEVRISNNLTGVRLKNSGKMILLNSQIYDNHGGIWLTDSSWVDIRNSAIYDNATGIVAGGLTWVRVDHGKIANNWQNGILLRERSQLALIDSVIRNNFLHGISTASLRCGGDWWQVFLGNIFFRRNNIIKENDICPFYLDPTLSVKTKVGKLLSIMPLEAKAAQLDMLDHSLLFRYGKLSSNAVERYLYRKPTVGSVLSRLFSFPTPKEAAKAMNQLQMEAKIGAAIHRRPWIPILIGTDCPLGASVRGSTIFPSGIGMASTWDPELIQTVGSKIAEESRALGIHQSYSPVLDISRDPRWGRIEETMGEDPYLTSIIGTAMVKGLQGEKLDTDHSIIATPKHFAGYGRVLGGRNGSFQSVSERELREIYLPPFEAAIKEGEARSVMAAYSELNGVPAVASKWLLTKILREEWGFEGFVTTDWEDIEALYRVFEVAATFGDAIKQALQAGADLHMLTHSGSYGFQDKLVELVRSGKLPEEVVDKAVRRILRVKFEMGLFEHPFVDPERAAEIIGSEENREVALQVARESLVLLKNEDDILPLTKNIESVAFVDLNDYLGSMLGYGYDWARQGTTIYEALQEIVPEEKIDSLSEWDLESETKQSLKIVEQADVVIIVSGEPGNWTGETWPGHERDRASLQLPEDDIEAIKTISNSTNTPIVVVMLSGRPLAINWLDDHIPAILWAWKPGVEGGEAIVDVLFGDYNSSGKLPISFPYTAGQIPVFYNKNPHTRRTDYIGTPEEALYPFGYGLSYTEFEYSNLEVSPKKVNIGGEVKISLDVKNTGDRAGTEVVQLYINDVISSVVTPVKELKGFKRITLSPGEKKKIEFILKTSQLSFLNREMKRIVEPGKFKVMVGSSSEDIRQVGSFEVVKE